MTAQKPLPERMRPDDPDLFLGQSHLASRLKSLMAAERLPSLLFFGPPGCGKSTLALLLARSRKRPYLRLSAPEAGLQHLRRSLNGIEILVLDELHRFSKAQQDFFLPLVESGELTLLATTTENPSFSVTRQLLSRLHVLRLRPLGRSELMELARRGAEQTGVTLSDEVLDIITAAAHGDARTLLNLVEYAASLPEEMREPEQLKSALPEVMMRHDKDGDSHYELASALIKSIRGSDPDAALYYLAWKAARTRASSAAASSFPLRRMWAWPIPMPCPWPSPASRPWNSWACPKASSRWPRRWSIWPWPARATAATPPI